MKYTSAVRMTLTSGARARASICWASLTPSSTTRTAHNRALIVRGTGCERRHALYSPMLGRGSAGAGSGALRPGRVCHQAPVVIETFALKCSCGRAYPLGALRHVMTSSPGDRRRQIGQAYL